MGMNKHTRSRRSADMSQKFGKRHKKKSDADVEANMEALHDEKDTNNGSAEKSNGDESELKGFTIEEIDDSATAQEGVQKKVEEEAENVNKIEENGRNGETESTKEETVKNADSQETQEPEATAADAEEMELQFDEDSDKDSNKGSPNSRCKTRRSQFRNIPTPKTPKSMCEQNGDDKEPVKGDTPQPENPEINEEEDAAPVLDNESKLETDSIANLSTCAVAGDNLSEKDLDLTLSDVPLRANQSDPLINPYKEKTLGETLRGLSSRRTIRSTQDYRKFALQSNMEKANLNFEKRTYLTRSSVERIPGSKRKHDNESPERTKKAKPNSPGLLSYITSPIGQLKTKFMRSEVPSSTPKLTGYKQQVEPFANVDVSNIETDEAPKKEENKWCIIM